MVIQFAVIQFAPSKCIMVLHTIKMNNNYTPHSKVVGGYSDDSLMRAAIVRKSCLSGQKVRESISVSGLIGDSVIRKTR